ncbi:MAG: mechanosensitive ion channel family protein [Steroidobacteraceae bacterium]|jgi:small-conductance mechanosensitive channel
MFDWIEICLALATTALLVCAFTPQLRPYRSLFLGGSALMTITVFFPRPGNSLGQLLFAQTTGSMHLPSELFGIAWWILGAWLIRSLLTLVLRRTIFPNDYQPHARRLFADLASGLVYIVAFVGIMDTVLKQPISALLATSGVLAIVLGLALQNTLADVFSGLAINIERSFGAGDWITMNDNVEGQIIEIDWRATRIRTFSNDMIVIPNSVISKAIVTNHRQLNEPYLCSLSLRIDSSVSPARVIKVLQSAASESHGVVPGNTPAAYACGFADSLVTYKLYFAVESYALTPEVQSEVITRVTDALLIDGIQIGTLPTDVRIIQNEAVAGAPKVAPSAISQPSGR